MIYFLRHRGPGGAKAPGNPIKIGYTRDIASLVARLGDYRTHSPYEPELLACLANCAGGTERALHKLLEEDRVHGSREWFEATDRVKTVVAFAEARPKMKHHAFMAAVEKALDPVASLPKSARARHNPLSRANMRKARKAGFERQVSEGMELSSFKHDVTVGRLQEVYDDELSPTEGET